ncbi:rhodanese-like domain-containing protein [Rhodococcus opacus]|uniref:rhodanese-like domain-containing protein n=1 Tax=Rhodococcus opacus TaxID=37919 RepID=UPI001C20BA53|nr:rhodanese-like domain-containing protein [Rhodococcus opacus]
MQDGAPAKLGERTERNAILGTGNSPPADRAVKHNRQIGLLPRGNRGARTRAGGQGSRHAPVVRTNVAGARHPNDCIDTPLGKIVKYIQYPLGYERCVMREIEIGEFADAWAAGAPVIDVREPWEYRNAHVPGAQLLPLGQLGDRVTEIPAGAVVYVICASGNRSVQGARILMTAGRPAVSVAGGTSGWAAAGRLLDTGDGGSCAQR